MAFTRPTYLASSAWLEHIPFAFWLVYQQRPRIFVELGTHYGCSYFAFCQAIEKLSLDAACYAIDTFKGDEHAGFYGEDVYGSVNHHNDTLYSQFSRVVRSTFDESVQYFEDGSVDILHIDGLHTFEAVLHDFQTWRPKLSDSGVVIMHDTNVRERGFGVCTMLAQLRTEFPVFEFNHGHGLGIVGVGKNQTAAMQALFAVDKQEESRRDVRNFFARLGRSCADTYAITKLQSQLKSTVNAHQAPL